MSIYVVQDSTDYSAGKASGPIVFVWKGTVDGKCADPEFDWEASARSTTLTKSIAWAATTYLQNSFDSAWQELITHGWLPANAQ